MNFKPTKLKIIFAFIALVVIGFIFSSILGNYPTPFYIGFLQMSAIFGIPAFIVVYVIFSLFQK